MRESDVDPLSEVAKKYCSISLLWTARVDQLLVASQQLNPIIDSAKSNILPQLLKEALRYHCCPLSELPCIHYGRARYANRNNFARIVFATSVLHESKYLPA